MSKIRIMYLRNNYGSGDSTPVGCVAIQLTPPNGMAKRSRDLHYQVSVLNPADKFDRETARLFAQGRLLEKPYLITIPADATMNEITAMVMSEILGNKSLPTRARNAAARWWGFNNWRQAERAVEDVGLDLIWNTENLLSEI